MNNVIAPSLGEAIRVSNNKSLYRKMKGIPVGDNVDWMAAGDELNRSKMLADRANPPAPEPEQPQGMGVQTPRTRRLQQNSLQSRVSGQSPYARMIQGAGQP